MSRVLLQICTAALGLGLAMLWTVPSIELQGTLFFWLWVAVCLGGAGRLLFWLVVGARRAPSSGS